MPFRKLPFPRTREQTLAVKRAWYRRTYHPRELEHPLIPGQRFTRLVVLVCYHEMGKPAVQCRCDCGETVYPRVSYLLKGRVRSCGCLRRDLNPALHAKAPGSEVRP